MPRLIRPIRIEGNIAFVTLTRGQTAIIDAEDVPLVEHWNWTAVECGRQFYPRRKSPSGVVHLHRQVMGEPEGMQVDHINGNPLDNRKANLRIATLTENRRNVGIRSHNTSGFKGVSWKKGNNKWFAQIKVNGQKHHLGYYHTAEAAHQAYCAASAEYHRDFGRVVDFERPSGYPCAFSEENF